MLTYVKSEAVKELVTLIVSWIWAKDRQRQIISHNNCGNQNNIVFSDAVLLGAMEPTHIVGMLEGSNNDI